ncbi:hypothetical protein JHK85_003991 [Glycine max]|nr:hypothetical protein JHK85_003991 [Glycine max]KAG5079755.1 hypothetical protein JHK86_003820 [Glycine max]
MKDGRNGPKEGPSVRKIRQHKAERKGWVWGGKGQSSSRSLKCDMNYDDKLGVCALGNDKKRSIVFRVTQRDRYIALPHILHSLIIYLCAFLKLCDKPETLQH